MPARGGDRMTRQARRTDGAPGGPDPSSCLLGPSSDRQVASTRTRAMAAALHVGTLLAGALLAGAVLMAAPPSARAAETPSKSPAARGAGTLLSGAFAPESAPPDRPRALLCGALIDGRAATPRRGPVAVVVKGDRIVTIVGRDVVPKDAEVIDLGGATLLPGLIELHSIPLIS